jgi:hypothetical protein
LTFGSGQVGDADPELLVDRRQVLLAQRRAERVVVEVDGDAHGPVQRRGRPVGVDVLVGRSDAGSQHQQTTSD